MASKFDRPGAWEAMEAEDRAHWASRSDSERAASVISLSSELLAVQRQSVSATASVADESHTAEKIRAWIALKEELLCPSASRQSSKTSSAVR